MQLLEADRCSHNCLVQRRYSITVTKYLHFIFAKCPLQSKLSAQPLSSLLIRKQLLSLRELKTSEPLWMTSHDSQSHVSSTANCFMRLGDVLLDFSSFFFTNVLHFIPAKNELLRHAPFQPSRQNKTTALYVSAKPRFLSITSTFLQYHIQIYELTFMSGEGRLVVPNERDGVDIRTFVLPEPTGTHHSIVGTSNVKFQPFCMIHIIEMLI